MYKFFNNKINKLIFSLVLLIISIISINHSLKKPVYKIKQVTQAVLTHDVNIENNYVKFRFSIENNSDFPVIFSFLNLHYNIIFNNNKVVSGRYVNYRLNLDIGLMEKKDYFVKIPLQKEKISKNKLIVKKIQYWGEMAIQFPMMIYKYKRTKPFEGEKEFK